MKEVLCPGQRSSRRSTKRVERSLRALQLLMLTVITVRMRVITGMRMLSVVMVGVTVTAIVSISIIVLQYTTTACRRRRTCKIVPPFCYIRQLRILADNIINNDSTASAASKCPSARHALTVRSKGQRSKSQSCQVRSRHGSAGRYDCL